MNILDSSSAMNNSNGNHDIQTNSTVSSKSLPPMYESEHRDSVLPPLSTSNGIGNLDPRLASALQSSES